MAILIILRSLTGLYTILIEINRQVQLFSYLQSPLQLTADAPIASAVITLTALDKDIGLRGKISYAVLEIAGSILSEQNNALHCTNDSYGTFTIDEHTGTLRVARSLAGWCRYNVTVRAMDHGNPSLFGVISVVIETGSRNATELRAPTTTAVIKQEGLWRLIVGLCSKRLFKEFFLKRSVEKYQNE